ncbi:hypothetical protein ULF88_01360 [Halopseudomonas pachastrellae]|nr:hypothetical protein [Halopseudomonas pachastrellae]
MGALADTLGISKQALHRPLTSCRTTAWCCTRVTRNRHRFKLLTLTDKGAEVEQQASDRERKAIGEALNRVSAEGQDGWYAVMQSLADRL